MKKKKRPCRDCNEDSYEIYCAKCKQKRKKEKAKEKSKVTEEEINALKSNIKPLGRVKDQSELDKIKKEKEAKKVEKARLKRKEKREQITDFKLDIIFGKVVKKFYPLFCHACLKPLVLGDRMTQAAHFVERGRKILRWDISNVIPACGTCNGFDSSHVYELGKWINKYWGEGTAEKHREIKVQTYKWTQPQKKELFDLFNLYMKDEIQNTDLLELYLKIRQ